MSKLVGYKLLTTYYLNGYRWIWLESPDGQVKWFSKQESQTFPYLGLVNHWVTVTHKGDEYLSLEPSCFLPDGTVVECPE